MSDNHTFQGILAGRKTAKFYLLDEDSPAERMARVLLAMAAEREAKVDPELPEELRRVARLVDPADASVIGELVSRYYQDREAKVAAVITLRAVMRSENERIRSYCKLTPRRMDPKTNEWTGGEPEDNDYAMMLLAFAIQEPAIDVQVPEDTKPEERERVELRLRATWLADNLTDTQIREVLEAVKQLNSFDLRRVEDKVRF